MEISEQCVVGLTWTLKDTLGDVLDVLDEPVEFLVQQLDRSFANRIEFVASLIEDVAGHADRGQRRAQLVTDVGGELPLKSAELLEVGDLLGQALGHVVERHRQPRHVVLTAHRHSLLESSIGESNGDT